MTRFRPRLGKPATTTVGIAVPLLAVLLWAPRAHAYPSYDDGSSPPAIAGCVECHSGFSGGPSSPLHGNHLTQLGIVGCNPCHPSGGSTKPVLTYWSGPGGGFGCAGCHGQDYGETSPTSGLSKATAYGLRQVHVSAGETSCGTAGGCHVPGSLGHSNPFPTLFGEDELPPYYAPIFSGLTDPCSSAQEDMPFDPDSVGLDNDGDGTVDGSGDLDCAVTGTATATATPTLTPTPTVAFACGAAPIGGCIVPEKAVLLVNEKKGGKEKLKVVLKKLEEPLVQGDFGNPFTGTTAYKVCVYDEADQLSGEYTVDKAAEICGGLSCWSAVSDKGYKYTDKGTSADGILKMKMLGGDAGKGKVLVIGKNKTATMPLGVAAALQDATSATVQVLSSDASCFGTSLSRVKKADGLIFKALSSEIDAADGINGGLMYDKFWSVDAGFDQADPNLSVFDASSNFFRCKQCHAWDRLGNTASYINRAPTTTRPNVSSVDLAAAVQALSPQELFDAIDTGSGAMRRSVSADLSGYDPAIPASTVVGDQMPNFGQILTEEQIWDLVKYLKEETLDSTDLYETTPTGVYPTGSRTFSDIGRDGDDVNGDALYAGKCAGCHGVDGTGGAFTIEGGAVTVGSHLRGKPYETWHKAKFGHPDSPMGPQGINDLADMKDLYKALTDVGMYPDPTP